MADITEPPPDSIFAPAFDPDSPDAWKNTIRKLAPGYSFDEPDGTKEDPWVWRVRDPRPHPDDEHWNARLSDLGVSRPLDDHFAQEMFRRIGHAHLFYGEMRQPRFWNLHAGGLAGPVLVNCVYGRCVFIRQRSGRGEPRFVSALGPDSALSRPPPVTWRDVRPFADGCEHFIRAAHIHASSDL